MCRRAIQTVLDYCPIIENDTKDANPQVVRLEKRWNGVQAKTELERSDFGTFDDQASSQVHIHIHNQQKRSLCLNSKFVLEIGSMPLASSVTSTQKRAQAVQEERRQQDRRQRLLQSKRRTSLPTTVPSSTVATQSKVERRRSLRRDSSQPQPLPPLKPTTNKQNDYCPPETRSATKKKKLKQTINPDFFQQTTTTNIINSNNTTSGGDLFPLQFSPPNQKENIRREQEKQEQNQAERDRRIAEAKQNGQLLVYSPSGRPLFTENNIHKGILQETMEQSVTIKNACVNANTNATKPMIPETNSESNHDAILQKMTQELTHLRQQQQTERRHSDAALLERIEGLLSHQQQLQLQTTNEQLQKELCQVQAQLLREKENAMVEIAQLSMKLQQSESALQQMQQTEEEWNAKTHELIEANTSMKIQIQTLEERWKQCQDQLDRTKIELSQIQEMGTQEQSAWTMQTKEWQTMQTNLEQQLQEARMEQTKLQSTLATYQKQAEQMQAVDIPELRAQVETERDCVARMETSLESCTMELELCQQELQKTKKALEQQQHHMRCEWEEQIQSKEKELMDVHQKELMQLHEQVRERQLQLETERQNVTAAQVALQQVQEAMHGERKQLNDALEETMMQLDQSQAENETVSKQLNQALKKIQAVQHDHTKQITVEREQRQRMEQQLAESQQSAHQLQQQLEVVQMERDAVRQGYTNREQELYDKLCICENVRRQLHEKLLHLMGNIRVFVRVRPMLTNDMEVLDGVDCKKKRKRLDEEGMEDQLFQYPGIYNHLRTSSSTQSSSSSCSTLATTLSGNDMTKNGVLIVKEPYKDRGGLSDRRKQWKFGFDHVFTPHHYQDDVWVATESMIQSAIDGYHVTIFAYGQTGSGKTYTMLGNDDNPGLIGRSVKKMFHEKHEMESISKSDTQVSLSVELLEVYNEKVRDLLSSNKDQDLKVTSSEVVGNIVVQTETADEVMAVLQLAQSRRCVKATGSNAESSRSHMIFTIHFKVVSKEGGGGEKERCGKLNICDLAGSERLNKSGTNTIGGTLLEESKNINKSLSVLSNVIERLQAGDSNVPFRESKLTFLLKNSLMGNSKTLAIVCCNPSAEHFHESLSSLRFAEKVNRIDLKAVANFSA